MSYQVPKHIDNAKIFIVNRSAIDNRLDAQYYNANLDLSGFVKLSSISIVKGGKRIPKGYGYSNEPTSYYYLRVADMVTETDIDINSFMHISKEVFDILERYEITEGELAISIAGTIGKLCILKTIPDDKRVILTENCAKILIKPSIELLPEYLKICLELPIVKKQLELNYIQTTIPKLGLDKILEIKIPPVPSLQKQNAIISYVNNAYTQKQKKEYESRQLIDRIDMYLLEQLGIRLPDIQTRTLQDRMFIVLKSVLEDRLDPYYSQEYFRYAFKVLESCKYPVMNLKEISKLITSGITPKSGGDAYTEDKSIGIPFVRSGNISIDGELNYDDLLYLKPEIHENVMNSSKLKKGDILIAIVGATIGQVGIYLSEGEANINQAIALVRLKEGYNVQFIKELIKSSLGQLSLNRLKRPVARANINLEEISRIKVVLPPEEKQQEIVEHITAIRQQAKSLQEEGKAILEQAKREVEEMIIG